MSTDISGFGLQLRITATNTFPTGFSVSQFADDADPFDIPELTIGEAAMGLNGELITWSKAVPIAINIAVVPDSDDDKNLAILFDANRVSKGKSSALDVISMTGVYPNGKIDTLTGGKIIAGMFGNSVASAGRFKSKTYKFMMEGGSGT